MDTKPQKHQKKMTRQTSSSMKIPSSHEIRPQRNLTNPSDISTQGRQAVESGKNADGTFHTLWSLCSLW